MPRVKNITLKSLKQNCIPLTSLLTFLVAKKNASKMEKQMPSSHIYNTTLF